MITKDEAIEAAKHVSVDLELLQSGHWQPDTESIEASQDNMQIVLDFLWGI